MIDTFFNTLLDNVMDGILWAFIFHPGLLFFGVPAFFFFAKWCEARNKRRAP